MREHPCCTTTVTCFFQAHTSACTIILLYTIIIAPHKDVPIAKAHRKHTKLAKQS